ncbi:MAG: DUF3710 domain-containing protein [Propionibacteriaceae bacterium]|jgi:hypothetical protein|nr:DUF3710 domain-containing protein [Propionibacteriaceae bacterium]
MQYELNTNRAEQKQKGQMMTDDALPQDSDFPEFPEFPEFPDSPELSEFTDDMLEDKWVNLDLSRDWREDGPFDISEVDLDADDVERLDFGTLIITPFDQMKLQLNVVGNTQEVQAIIVTLGKSMLDLTLFAAPKSANMVAEVRSKVLEAGEAADAYTELVPGPFGTEIRQDVPVTLPNGKKSVQHIRIWLVQGPGWLLRGTIMGAAGSAEGVDAATADLYDFFCNVVVTRPEQPLAPGALIPMAAPEGLLPKQR